MTDLEDLLVDSLHRHAADAPVGTRMLSGVLQKARRRWRRVRLATAGGVVGLAIALTAAGLIVTTHGRSEQRTTTEQPKTTGQPNTTGQPTVTGRTPSPAVPVAGAPSSAAPHSTAVDSGKVRLWLPPSWTAPTAGPACANQGRIDRSSAALTLAPCDDQHTTQLAVVAHTSLRRMSGTHVTIDGLAAVVQRRRDPCCNAASRIGEVIDIPALASEIVAYTPAAMRIARTLQPSAARDILQDRTPVSAPAGWETVRYDGISVRLPEQWPSTVSECGSGRADRPAFAYPGVGLRCPVIPTFLDLKRELEFADGVYATPLSSAEQSPGASRVSPDGSVEAQVSISDDEPPSLSVQLTAGADHVELDIGIGHDPTIAAAILDSITASPMRAPTGPVPEIDPTVIKAVNHTDSTHIVLRAQQVTHSSRAAAIAKVRGASQSPNEVQAASLGELHDDTHRSGVLIWVVQTAPEGGTAILTRPGTRKPADPQIVELTFVDADNGREIGEIDFSANLP
jgi:hypothetical protein